MNPMSLDQLIELYILQKDYHQFLDVKERAKGYSSSSYHIDQFLEESKKQFEKAYSLLLDKKEILASDLLAPSLFKNQPDIPFILLKPIEATEENRKPLIIHTHGGPHIHINTNIIHAEIAYFLSHGYVVACPNYRGSTNNTVVEANDFADDPDYLIGEPTLTEWAKWQDKSKNKHHIYGPQDVYTVAKYMQSRPYVDSKKLFLRGGSFGSFINAHLLTKIKTGKFENIFLGVHFSGGVNYPISELMPDNIPLLITHAKKDEIASFEEARLFMEQLLIRAESNNTHSIHTFIAAHGNHHLINPITSLDVT